MYHSARLRFIFIGHYKFSRQVTKFWLSSIISGHKWLQAHRKTPLNVCTPKSSKNCCKLHCDLRECILTRRIFYYYVQSLNNCFRGKFFLQHMPFLDKSTTRERRRRYLARNHCRHINIATILGTPTIKSFQTGVGKFQYKGDASLATLLFNASSSSNMFCIDFPQRS